METVKIVHPLNPNIYSTVDIPMVPIGLELTVDNLQSLYALYELVLKEAHVENPQKYITNLMAVVGNFKYGTVRLGVIYYNIMLMLGKTKEFDTLAKAENYLHETYPEFLKGIDRVFSQPTPTLEVIENENDFVEVEVAVYRGLKPLYRFLSLLMTFSGLGTDEADMYKVRGTIKNQPLRKLRSPVIYQGIEDFKTFKAENDFLGKPLLEAIKYGEKLTPTLVWNKISTDTFEEILNARVYGAMKAAWKTLGSPFKEHGGIKLFISSEEVDAVFAELAGLRMRATQSGNAYPGFVRGGQTTYRVSSGIKTQRIMNARIGNLTIWMKKHVMWSKREQQLVIVGD